MLKSLLHFFVVLTVTLFILKPAHSSEQILQHTSEELTFFLEQPFTEEDKISTKRLSLNILSMDLDQLLENQNLLRETRNQLETYPTLRLIAFMASDSDISQMIRSIGLEDVRVHFVLAWLELLLKGLSESELFNQQLSGFSEFLKLDSTTIQSYIEQENYLGLIRQLFFL